jgi:hypothetical protein
MAFLFAIRQSDFKTADTRQENLHHLFTAEYSCYQPYSFRPHLCISKYTPCTLTCHPTGFSVIYKCQKKAAAKPFHPDTACFKSVALKYPRRYLALGISP